DRLPVKLIEVASAIEQKYRGEVLFTALKNRCWPALCSYTHTGMLQLAKRFIGHNAEPAYIDTDIAVAMTTVTTCILYLVGNFFAVQNHDTERREAEELLGMYGLMTTQNPQPGA